VVVSGGEWWEGVGKRRERTEKKKLERKEEGEDRNI
jgi:hypothetical protein